MSFVPAAVIATAWVRLETPLDRPQRFVGVAALALLAALLRPPALRVAGIVVAAAFAGWIAFEESPFQPRHFPGTVGHRFSNGFLDFYDVRTPFDPRTHQEMRGVILAAIFGFVVALTCAVAARRPLLAVLAVLVGVGWPATLRGPTDALWLGVALLLSVLIVLAGLTTRHVPRIVMPAAAGLVLLAVVASTSAAVAKTGVVSWQHWDPYNAPQPPVSVSFVWNADYSGLRWPAKRTKVLEVKAPHQSLYWRAAVLDAFSDDRWQSTPPLRGDALVPSEGKPLVRQDVTIFALDDTRLVGASVPVRYDTGDAPTVVQAPGLEELRSSLTRGFHYTAFSYAPQPTVAQLAASKPIYPIVLTEPGTFLDVQPHLTALPFAAPNRERRIERLLLTQPVAPRYTPLAQLAFQVAGSARTPYGAASTLERWFRSTGGFTYSDLPPLVPTQPPLVGFVTTTRQGYCQLYAGAMALMLRFLGVPARVAVGFSSGTYNAKRGVWTVTDRDAHAWVEAWFRGYGWLPFDPTPSGRPERGQLSAPYAAAQRLLPQGGSQAPSFGPGANSQQDASRHGETPGTGVKTFRPGTAHSTHRWRRSLVLLLLMILAGGTLVIALSKIAARRVRYATRDPRRVAAACRQELADYLLDQRIEAARSATLHELGALVRHELAVDPDLFVAAATAARFGPPEGAPAAARRARRELRALLRTMRIRLRARDRIRGLVSLRSFGFAP